MKKYVLILLSLYSIGSYATTHDASADNSNNNNNNLLVQLVDTKLANMDDKLTRVEKANQEAMAELNDKVDTKLADKFKQLDDRAGDINFWFTLIGWAWAIFGVLIPLVGGWLLRKKVNDNIDESKQDLALFKQESKSKIEDQLAYAEKILALIKENHSRSKQLTEKQEEMRKQPPLEVTDENKDDIAKIIRVTEEQPENQLNAKDWFIKGLDAANKREYYEAVTYFSKAIKLSGADVNKASSYCNRGVAKCELGQHREAIQDYDEAIKLNPKDADLYNNRGTANAKLGQHSEAIQDYDKAIELNPKYASAYGNRGNVKLDLKQYIEAIQDYDEAIRLNPKYAQVYYNRGNTKAKLGQYTEAIQDYDEAIELNPKYMEAYYNRGIYKAKLGQYIEAIQDYDEAIRLDLEDAQTYNNRGIAKAKLGQYAESIQDYDKAIELNPKDADLYNNRGNTRIRLGQYTEAIQDYDEAIELNPKFADAYNNRGVLKVILGQYNEAIKDYDKAIELDSKHVNAYFNKSCAYALQNDKVQALIWLDKALQLGCPVADIMQDGDWQHYRNDVEFKELISKYDKNNHANRS